MIHLCKNLRKLLLQYNCCLDQTVTLVFNTKKDNDTNLFMNRKNPLLPMAFLSQNDDFSTMIQNFKLLKSLEAFGDDDGIAQYIVTFILSVTQLIKLDMLPHQLYRYVYFIKYFLLKYYNATYTGENNATFLNNCSMNSANEKPLLPLFLKNYIENLFINTTGPGKLVRILRYYDGIKPMYLIALISYRFELKFAEI